MEAKIGITDDGRAGVAGLLQVLLADEHVLYLKTRNAHWNVTGPMFKPLHDFFEGQYDELEGFIDDIAERIQQVGHPAVGTFAEYLKLTRLKELEGFGHDAKEYVRILLNDHETLIRHLRKDLEKAQDTHADVGTGDFLTGLMQSHEKMAWMLRATLKS